MIKHPEYRAFERSRIAANDAMMALAIGARLAGHLLSQSPDEDADRLLPDVFPTVEGAQKLNRTVEDARLLISSAETHLAYMAIPFALSVHQTYCVQALRLLRRDGIDTATDDPFLIRLEHLHERLMIWRWDCASI